MNAAALAWIVLAAILVLAAIILVIREIPSIQRELRLLRM